jgi:hypothetical protein
VASLFGLALTIAAAVGLGSMMGGTEQRIPLAQDPPTVTVDGEGGVTVDPSALDGLIGNVGGGDGSEVDIDGSAGGHVSTDPDDPTPDIDVDLPDDPGPAFVPPLPDTITDVLSDGELTDFIDDVTGQSPSDPNGLLDGVVDTVGGVVGGATGVVVGLLGH